LPRELCSIYNLDMRAAIQKWGNSLALRIPAVVAEEISVREGDAVELEVSERRLVVKPGRKVYDLKELIKKIKRENIHKGTDWGQPSGKEVW
jgi:antitoxin MazE